MNHISFEWDENKNRANQVKHKVSFEEAKLAFYDPNALEFMIHEIQTKLRIDFYF